MNKESKIANHIIETNVVKVDRTGVGYKQVPHPYNFDYSCYPVEDEVTKFESTTPKVVDPELKLNLIMLKKM